MKTCKPKAEVDRRTPAQRAADEAAARAAETGDWSGFETEELLTEEGARQILEHCQTLDRQSVLAQLTKHPFRWKHYVFRILRCKYADGKAHVEVSPDNPEFAAEVKKRIEGNRFHYLPYYQGFGFISFPEDYLRYKD